MTTHDQMTGPEASGLVPSLRAPRRIPGLPTRRPVSRKVAILAAVTLLAVAALVVPGIVFRADSASGSAMDYVSRINALRASRGVAPLEVDGNLNALAQNHAAGMAASQVLRHSGALASGVSLPWRKLGENIGMGPNTDMVWTAFVNSPSHLGNILNPAYTHIGVGVVTDGAGMEWTTQRFLQIAQVATNVEATPAPPPTRPPATAAPKRQAPTTTQPPPPVEPPPAPEPPPPPPVEPSPADPTRVASVLEALRVPATSASTADPTRLRTSAVLIALRAL